MQTQIQTVSRNIGLFTRQTSDLLNTKPLKIFTYVLFVDKLKQDKRIAQSDARTSSVALADKMVGSEAWAGSWLGSGDGADTGLHSGAQADTGLSFSGMDLEEQWTVKQHKSSSSSTSEVETM